MAISDKNNKIINYISPREASDKIILAKQLLLDLLDQKIKKQPLNSSSRDQLVIIEEELKYLEGILPFGDFRSKIHKSRGSISSSLRGFEFAYDEEFILQLQGIVKAINTTEGTQSSLVDVFSSDIRSLGLDANQKNALDQIIMNAIIHGGAAPTVDIRHDKDTSILTVHNDCVDGKIVSPDQIKAIQDGIKTGKYVGKDVSTSGSNGIGMTEIIDTRRSIPGAMLIITSSVKEGTTFTVKIPTSSLQKQQSSKRRLHD